MKDEGHRLIEQILAEHYGDAYEPPKEKPVINGGGDSGSPYRDLNNAALGNLDAWVPHLGIHRCKPQRGRFRSFVGVAQWRESTSGKTLEQREPNLKICGSGIRDFGDNRGYTPIDLVVAARSRDLREAVTWLGEKLNWFNGGPEIDLPAMKANQAEAQKKPKGRHV